MVLNYKRAANMSLMIEQVKITYSMCRACEVSVHRGFYKTVRILGKRLTNNQVKEFKGGLVRKD